MQALCQHVLLGWLSAAGVRMTAGRKPLVAGAAEHICALGP